MQNTLKWLHRNCDINHSKGERDYFVGVYGGHRVRLLPDGLMQVGHKDFDRWANSVAYSCKIDERTSIPRQINMSLLVAKQDNREWQERSFDVMIALQNQMCK
jgi:hypothetical protein